MSERTLYDKVWENHRVTTLPNGQDQLFVGRATSMSRSLSIPNACGLVTSWMRCRPTNSWS